MDHDDLLPAHALYCVAECIMAHPDVRVEAELRIRVLRPERELELRRVQRQVGDAVEYLVGPERVAVDFGAVDADDQSAKLV